MSISSARHESERWLKTAEQDHAAAVSLKVAGHHAQACFLAQQAAEKAVKALWFAQDTDPWGHSVQKLLSELPGYPTLTNDQSLLRIAARLDRLYIPTRYPNGIPDLTPGDTYAHEDSQDAIDNAAKILATIRILLDE